MNVSNCIIALALLFAFASCDENKLEQHIEEAGKKTATDLNLDHFNIWVKNPKDVKQRLMDIGFTVVPDSLSTIHEGQGTTGRYFYFLNSYLELIFIYDQEEFDQNNRTNKDLDFIERSNFAKNGALPFGVALKVKDYKTEKIPFEKIKYHQHWMEENSSIYVAKNSKIRLKEPSIFVVYPKIEYDVFETIADLKNIPEEYAMWRQFYKHPNGAKKVTDIKITSTDLDLTSETMKALNGIEHIEVGNGSEYLMELYFDDNVQRKSFDLRPELPLIIYL